MAAQVFYADVSRPGDPREGACAEETAEDVLLDELVLGFVGRGLGAESARDCARVALALFRSMDRRVCGVEASEALVANVCASGAVVPVEKLRAACNRMWDLPDARKGLGAMFFAMGWALHGCGSMRSLARMRGVSVEDVSNVVDDLQGLLGQPRNGLQKSEAAVNSYQRENGATRQKCVE